jgi:pantetheine-phosphate adenylyltransferase
MVCALYPGTFDPITLGHMRIIERVIPLFDKVTIGVSCNETKEPLFSTEERMELIKQVFEGVAGLEVVSYEHLTVDYARKIGARVIIRGLRAVTDYVSEVQMAIMNRSIAPDIETLLMVAEEGFSFVSSSLIKEIVKHGGPVDHLVPEPVAAALKVKLKDKYPCDRHLK